MILPTSYFSVVVLLVVSFICLGLWVNTFKLTGGRWRFELFSIDFAIGVLLLSLIAAFTLGSLGSDLAFTDRMLVAGHAAQAFGAAAGCIFNLGNMLLLAAVSLLGMAGAFPLSIGIALIVASLFNLHGSNIWLLVGGILFLLVTVVLDGSACRLRDRRATAHRVSKDTVAQHADAKHADTAHPVRTATVAAKPAQAKASAPSSRTAVKPTAKAKARRTAKGLVVAVLSGVALGVFYPVAAKGTAGEFGLGPYAGMLMFSVGVLLSTIVLNFYFLNISIDNEPLSFGAYFHGNVRQHLLGFAGGAVWAGGALAAALAASVTLPSGVPPALVLILPLCSVLLVMLFGTMRWKEFASAPRHAKAWLGLTALLFTVGLVLLGIGIAS